MAQSLSYDPPLAKLLGEMFDIVGAYGRLEIRAGRSRELEREYVEGMYWDWGLCSREMVVDHSRLRTEFENPAILISDLEIDDPEQLLPALEMALRAEIPVAGNRGWQDFGSGHRIPVGQQEPEQVPGDRR